MMLQFLDFKSMKVLFEGLMLKCDASRWSAVTKQ